MKNKVYIVLYLIFIYSADSIASDKGIIKFVSDLKSQRIEANISNRLDDIIRSNEDLMQSKLQQRDTIIQKNKSSKFSTTDIDVMGRLIADYKRLKAQNESIEEFREKVSDLNSIIQKIRENKDDFEKAVSSKSISTEQLSVIKDLFDQLNSMQSKKFDFKSAKNLLDQIENKSEILESFKNDFAEYIKTQKEINRSRTSTENLITEINNSIDNRSVISEEPDTVTTENPLYRRRRAASEDTNKSVVQEDEPSSRSGFNEFEESGFEGHMGLE